MIKRFLKTLIPSALVLAALFYPRAAGAAVYTLYASDDTKLDQGSQNTNFASEGNTLLGPWGENDVFIFKFDLSGIASEDVIEAELKLYESTRGGQHNFDLYRVLRNWVEAEATWNIFSTGNSWGTAGALNSTTDYTTTNAILGTANQNGGWMVFDATNLVKDMIDNGNYGFLLRSSTSSTYDYIYTSEEAESGEYRPVLTVRTGTVGVAETFYIRTDGGTCGLGFQCTGLTDAAYPGSGINQDCACSGPDYAFGTSSISAVVGGGDTVYIAAGTYTISSELNYVAAGSNSSDQTKVYGAGWDLNCTSPPVFTGNGVNYLFKIDDYTDVRCLKLTDTNGCLHSTARPQNADGKIDNEATQDNIVCSGGDAFANIGLKIADSSTGVYVKDVEITGMTLRGIEAYGLGEMSFIDSEIYGAGYIGWDGDPTSGPESYVGPITFQGSKIMYSGCGWRAKATPGGYGASTPHNCYSQNQAGYGDGFGLNGFSGNWVVLDSEASFNVSDGLDFLYGSTGIIKVARSRFEGNAGAAVKSGNPYTYIENSVLIGNCAHWSESEWVYASINAPGRSGSNCDSDSTCDANENWTNCGIDCPPFNICRPANHATLSLSAYAGSETQLINSTLTGNSDVLLFFSGSGCGATSVIKAYNNIIIGATEYNGGESDTSDWYYTECGGTPTLTEDYNLIAQTKTWATDCDGANSTCYENYTSLALTGPIDNWTPDYADYNSDTTHFDSYTLTASSTGALDTADESIAALLYYGSNDVEGLSRGASWDIGAFEYNLGVTGRGTAVGRIDASGREAAVGRNAASGRNSVE